MNLLCYYTFCLCRKIQSVFELADGSGLAVTVARYETPAHTDIDKVRFLFQLYFSQVYFSHLYSCIVCEHKVSQIWVLKVLISFHMNTSLFKHHLQFHINFLYL